MSSSYSIPGTSIGRPTQREDFSHETATVSLAGESYFFSGPARSYGRVHRGMGGQPKLDFDHRKGLDKTTYIILGPDPHFFQCRRYTEGNIAAKSKCSELEDYGEIADLYTEHDVERPSFLYLGPNKTFYTRVDDGTEKWELPHDVVRQGLQVTSDAVRSAVNSLWLGVGDAWVAQYRDSRFRFDLKGQYSNLEPVLRQKQYQEVSINALGLNVADGKSYVCVFNDGDVVYEAGSARFDGKELEAWCEQNFRFTQRLRFA
ncbi:uncharacterized protein FPRO_13230 [Fusarium proliferatum ET1]|uniref:Uncharacterized protein n=1 Tax=Fusarium proliferatum (strain ET1) TaxID=1227346 RepID=A0A1L7W4L8_FUSPR|nr:uncharacterized protein FPRO_13230 [Fusarium proliferatum ET1]CVL09719.1 uncharacterized protein FPRN_12657 [Fusarium proliferatum]CZR47563.1 uncharacterized protein FPRO_13230 [Fusarium proliferatum ET1]